jgi:hypothetical protein
MALPRHWLCASMGSIAIWSAASCELGSLLQNARLQCQRNATNFVLALIVLPTLQTTQCDQGQGLTNVARWGQFLLVLKGCSLSRDGARMK